ncbi:Tautomerase/MIF superfamily [Podospora fimiseda]|uniref:L-dopachrome isomerase n=1 Tax=Podospora fimiseda TaxID=252190 RepID=A0AAN7BLH2_9PEZI|nr:Tautomerase/MIF superfamily [Podospora fimiseda]
MTAPTGQLKQSFAERKTEKKASTASYLALPGDVVRRAHKAPSKPELAKQRSRIDFFEDVFSLNETSSARERVHGDAVVMAEVKTNVIISDEFTFITTLSYHLSTRYQRPVTSIVVTLQHGACMFFGGSFDPAYVMSIFALPSQLLPTTNKRNTALIQKHMEEAIGVVPARGVLRFVPATEEQLASNGKTVAGEIDDLEKSMGQVTGEKDGAGDAQGNISRGVKARKKLSVRTLANFRPVSVSGYPVSEITPPASADEGLPPIPGSPRESVVAEESTEVVLAQQQRTARRKKSFVATIFGRSGGKASSDHHRSSLPVILSER